MAEPGFWTMTDDEAAAFRAYLLKGGFVIFDDFAENRGGWDTFRVRVPARAARRAVLSISTPSHPIFHSFFEIAVRLISCRRRTILGRPVLRGSSRRTTRRKRLMAMINYNTDISEYWEDARHRLAARLGDATKRISSA